MLVMQICVPFRGIDSKERQESFGSGNEITCTESGCSNARAKEGPSQARVVYDRTVQNAEVRVDKS